MSSTAMPPEAGGAALDEMELRHVIAEARGMAELGAAARRVARGLGFNQFMCAIRVHKESGEATHYVLNGYSKQWRNHYDANGFFFIDPVVPLLQSSPVPFCWDDLVLDTPAARRVFSDAASFGLCHGLTAPAHFRSGEFGFMSLARLEPIRQGQERLLLLQKSQWFASLLLERMRPLAIEAAQQNTRPGWRRLLTARERECLSYVGQGFTGVQIGEHLGITTNTVAYHLNSAARKMGVRRRAAAAARAAHAGVIAPEGFPSAFSRSEKLLDIRT